MIAGKTGCRSAAAAILSAPCSCALQEKEIRTTRARIQLRLDTQHHDFSGLDESSRRFTHLEAHFPCRFGGDDGSNDLPADGKLDLCQEPIDLQLDNAASELITPAERPQHFPLWGFRALRLVQQAVQFRLRNAVVAARRLYRLQFSAVDPLLDRGIRDPQSLSGFAW